MLIHTIPVIQTTSMIKFRSFQTISMIPVHIIPEFYHFLMKCSHISRRGTTVVRLVLLGITNRPSVPLTHRSKYTKTPWVELLTLTFKVQYLVRQAVRLRQFIVRFPQLSKFRLCLFQLVLQSNLFLLNTITSTNRHFLLGQSVASLLPRYLTLFTKENAFVD